MSITLKPDAIQTIINDPILSPRIKRLKSFLDHDQAHKYTSKIVSLVAESVINEASLNRNSLPKKVQKLVILEQRSLSEKCTCNPKNLSLIAGALQLRDAIARVRTVCRQNNSVLEYQQLSKICDRIDVKPKDTVLQSLTGLSLDGKINLQLIGQLIQSIVSTEDEPTRLALARRCATLTPMFLKYFNLGIDARLEMAQLCISTHSEKLNQPEYINHFDLDYASRIALAKYLAKYVPSTYANMACFSIEKEEDIWSIFQEFIQSIGYTDELDASIQAIKEQQLSPFQLTTTLRFLWQAAAIFQPLPISDRKAFFESPLFAALLRLRNPELRMAFISQFEMDGGPTTQAKKFLEIIVRSSVEKKDEYTLLSFLLESMEHFDPELLNKLKNQVKRHPSFRDARTFQVLLKSLILLRNAVTCYGNEILGKVLESGDLKENILLLRAVLEVNGAESKAFYPQNVHNRTFKQICNDIFASLFKEESYPLQKKLAPFLTSRNPYAIYSYLASLVSEGEEGGIQLLKIFIDSVYDGSFKDLRYSTDKNIHLKKIAENQTPVLEAWKKSSSSESIQDLEGYTVVNSDDPIDFLLCGTEVQGSCHYVTSSNKTIGLLGLTLNGQNRIIAIKDRSGKMVARSIARILWDEENPVLFLESVYYGPVAKEPYKNAILSRAKSLSKELGIPSTGVDYPGIHYPKPLLALGGGFPEDCDAAGGNLQNDGKFTILNPLLI